jgi:chromosome partitioning protein
LHFLIFATKNSFIKKLTDEEVAMLTVALANQKGGVGKTATAVNLGAALVRKGKRILIVDMDPQANAGICLVGPEGANTQPTVLEVMKGEADLSAAIKPVSTIQGLDLLPCNITLSLAESELSGEVGRERFLADALEGAQGYDYVFIDCPPSLSLLTINALAAANEVLVPCQAHFLAMTGLSILWGAVNRVKRVNKALKIEGVVGTFFNARESQCVDVMNQLREKFGTTVYAAVIRRNTDIAKAAAWTEPIVTAEPHSLGGQDYLTLADEFLKRHKGRSAK